MLQMEGVDHVDVIQIRGRGFIGQIDGMLQGKVPNREGLEFGVTGFDAMERIMVDLR